MYTYTQLQSIDEAHGSLGYTLASGGDGDRPRQAWECYPLDGQNRTVCRSHVKSMKLAAYRPIESPASSKVENILSGEYARAN